MLKPTARSLLVKVTRFIIAVVVIYFTVVIISAVTIILTVIVPDVAVIVPTIAVYCSRCYCYCFRCCYCYYCYLTFEELIDHEREAMKRQRRESYRTCHLIYCGHVSHDDTYNQYEEWRRGDKKRVNDIVTSTIHKNHHSPLARKQTPRQMKERILTLPWIISIDCKRPLMAITLTCAQLKSTN